jgi:hypothetical protein
MGDCDLAEIKQLYGEPDCIDGKLHTTRLMLMGTEAMWNIACPGSN